MLTPFSFAMQLLETNTNFSQAQSQYMQNLKQFRGQVDNSVPKDSFAELQNRLAEEQEMVRKLKGDLHFQTQQMRRQLAIYQVRKNCTFLMQMEGGGCYACAWLEGSDVETIRGYVESF